MQGSLSSCLRQLLFCCILEDSHLTLTSLIYGIYLYVNIDIYIYISSERTLRVFFLKICYLFWIYYLMYMYVSMWMSGNYVLEKIRRHKTWTWSPQYLWAPPGGYRDQTSSSLEEQWSLLKHWAISPALPVLSWFALPKWLQVSGYFFSYNYWQIELLFWSACSVPWPIYWLTYLLIWCYLFCLSSFYILDVNPLSDS